MTQHLPSGLGQDPAHFVPHRFGSLPAPPTHPRHRPGAGRFLVVVMLLTGLVVAGLQTLPMMDTAPPNPAPSQPRATTAREPAPARTARPGNPLTDSRLYPLQVSGNCPTIRRVTSRSAYEKQAGDLLTCLAGIFEPLIERAGGEFKPVQHRFYGSSTSSPCGDSRDAYAFYCEENATIYFSNRVYDNARYARLVVADVVLHEYGHHVQSMMGMFDAAEDLDEDRASIVRREELQVFCWTYYIFAAVPSFDLTADDRNLFREIWGQTDDPKGHGSVKAQQYWGARGLGGTDLGACNTWSVPKERVR